MCRGRHRAENRVSEVQVRGGVGRGGVGWGGVEWGWHGTNVFLYHRKTCMRLSVFAVTKSRARHCFKAVLSKLHVRMAPGIDDLSARQICSVAGSRCIRVGLWSNDGVAHPKLPSNLAISFDAGWRSQDFGLPRLKQVGACESCDLRLPTFEVSWHAKLKPLT